MKIAKDKMVSLVYELRETDSDGRIIETVNEIRPMRFIYGSGRVLPHFESSLGSLADGDDFSFTLKSDMAYGARMEDMIVDVPISIFQTDGKLNEEICQIGKEVPMMDNEGNPLNGVINEITETYVKMDFNHPMAGLDLFFSGKVLEVRDATDQELAGNMNSCSGCGSGTQSGCNGSC